MADLKISALNSLAGADLVAADVVAVVDDSASETKKLTVSDLIANGTTLISDATIPSAKILFSAGAIDTAELAASAVETEKINNSAVTAAKLADNSSVTLVSTLPASGDFTGQIALDTDDDKIYIWDGSAWDSVKGAGSINVVNGSTSGEVNIVASTSDDTVTISATLDDTTAAAQFLAGPTGSAGTVGYRAIIGTDLPAATTTTKGAVIVNGEGLRMDSDTIEIDNDLTANTSTFQAVKFDSKGLITSGRDITSADLPDATSGATGAVKPGTGLEMGTGGAIDHSNSVTGATNTKITFDAQGHVTAGTDLAASDIPDLDTAKITTGTFPTARIADDAVTAAKLANFTVAQISETTPTADFTSQFFFNPITRDLFLWDGNVFQPVGISAGEIVLAGTYDANTNQLDSVTADGTAAGFESGSALPAAATGNNRHYVVVSQSGTGTSPAPTVTLEPPDILLSNGTSYVLIETSETITAQVASNVGFTATGNIASTNVQGAIAEVDNEKVAKGGDTMTGDLTLNDADIVFEGATENDFETTLTVTDPTADRTITLPNVTGTVVTTGDTGSVTSTMILDGTIANADISSSAEIAVSKLANGTARQLLQTDVAGTGVEFTSNVDVPGTLDVTGAATLDSTLDVTGVISADGKVKFPAGTASAPSFYFGTDTNTGLYHSAADEVAITTGGTQRIAVDSSGRLLVGTGSSRSNWYNGSGRDPQIQLEQSGNTRLGLTRTDDSNNGPELLFGGTRGSSYEIVSSGDEIGEISFQGADGSELVEAANIKALVDGTPGANDMPGRLVFSTTADGASSPSERLRIDSSGNVGIGNSSPDGRLHVQDTANDLQIRVGGTTAGRDPLIRLQGRNTADDTNVYADIKLDSDNQLLLLNDPGTTGGTIGQNPVAIDSSGNVGIGIAPTTHNLHIHTGDSDNNFIHLTNTTTGSTAGDGVILGLDSDESLLISQKENNHIEVHTNNTERMRIDSSGNVGIGTTSPGQALHVVGTIRATTDFQLRDSSNNRVLVIEDAFNDARISNEVNGGDIIFRTNSGSNSERLRIDSSGRLLVGTTSNFVRGNVQVIDSGGGELTIGRNDTSVSSGNDLGHIFFASSAGGTANACASIQCYADADQGSGDYPTRLMFSTTADGASSPSERMRIGTGGMISYLADAGWESQILYNKNSAGSVRSFIIGRYSATALTGASGTDGTISFQVTTNGNVTNTNNSYGAISDAKLKENIVDASSQWDDIKDLRVRNYNFIEGQTHTQIGVVAQEVETVSPGLVTESPDTDDEGNDLGTVTKSVNYSVLYMKAVKALQEAMDRIETLEAKVAALEAE